jgi:hypothetical protein
VSKDTARQAKLASKISRVFYINEWEQEVGQAADNEALEAIQSAHTV